MWVRLGRVAWWTLVALLLPGALVLWEVSAEAASQFPEFAHLRGPLYVAVVAGAVPILLAAPVVDELLVRVARGELGTDRSVRLLHRLAGLIAGFGVYAALVFFGAIVALGQGHPGLALAWIGIEAASVFGFVAVGLLARVARSIQAVGATGRSTAGAT